MSLRFRKLDVVHEARSEECEGIVLERLRGRFEGLCCLCYAVRAGVKQGLSEGGRVGV